MAIRCDLVVTLWMTIITLITIKSSDTLQYYSVLCVFVLLMCENSQGKRAGVGDGSPAWAVGGQQLLEIGRHVSLCMMSCKPSICIFEPHELYKVSYALNFISILLLTT